MSLDCYPPIPVTYIQMRTKIVLSNNSFIHDFDENNAPVVKVLGEVVEINEVVFSADGDKNNDMRREISPVSHEEADSKPN